MVDEPDRLPPWVTWQHRPFPDANLLLLPGRNPALVDSGFVGHAGQTADWVHARTGQLPHCTCSAAPSAPYGEFGIDGGYLRVCQRAGG